MSKKACIDESTNKGLKYFASANSGNGFYSYFDLIFDPLEFERIFVLKGGPGTGKSSLMKELSKTAAKNGACVDEILCSSDPDSLDGIIIKTKRGRIAVLDGTSPHTREACIPGAVDELVDLGSYWNKEMLTVHRDEIIMLQKRKADSYKNAYAFLSSAETLLKRKQAILDECIDVDKLEGALTRLIGCGIGKVDQHKITYRLSNAISAKGPFSCNVYSGQLGDCIPVYGLHGASYAVLNRILSYTKNKFDLIISPSPLQPYIIDGIFVKDIALCFYDAGKYKPQDAHKCINSERFIIDKAVKDRKNDLRVLTGSYEALISNAYEQLANTRKFHFELEKIYTRAMDFKAMIRTEEYIKNDIKAFCV